MFKCSTLDGERMESHRTLSSYDIKPNDIFLWVLLLDREMENCIQRMQNLKFGFSDEEDDSSNEEDNVKNYRATNVRAKMENSRIDQTVKISIIINYRL